MKTVVVCFVALMALGGPQVGAANAADTAPALKADAQQVAERGDSSQRSGDRSNCHRKKSEPTA